MARSKNNWRAFLRNIAPHLTTHLAVRRKGSHDDDLKAKLNTPSHEIDVGDGPTQKPEPPRLRAATGSYRIFFFHLRPERNAIVGNTTYDATHMPVWAPLPKKIVGPSLKTSLFSRVGGPACCRRRVLSDRCTHWVGVSRVGGFDPDTSGGTGSLLSVTPPRNAHNMVEK